MPEMSFGADRLAKVAEMEREHFWFKGRRLIIQAMIERFLSSDSGRVIDVGCGTGTMLEGLRRFGLTPVGVDQRREGLRALKDRSPKACLLQSEGEALPFRGKIFAGLLMLDVLEHLDDVRALREARRVLHPGGVLIASVPAHPWLWSYRDRGAGHQRRYTKRTLNRRMNDAKLTVEEVFYSHFALFPLLVLSRWLGRASPAMRDLEDQTLPFLNPLFSWITRAESKLSAFGMRWPWGSSLIVVARRSDG
jgi:ubiquinone/menaquinone biosynthesis C-methylase UbiE